MKLLIYFATLVSAIRLNSKFIPGNFEDNDLYYGKRMNLVEANSKSDPIFGSLGEPVKPKKEMTKAEEEEYRLRSFQPVEFQNDNVDTVDSISWAENKLG